jgi:exopolyphosphatase/guanosine-5'-triphosphate,3'-diphosphate pyrophosphatase
MREAVVDIGSNSTRLMIADVEGGRVTDELERRSTITRLGAGVDVDGRLRDDAMQRVFETLDRYGVEIDRRRCDVRLAVLTSAVRDSANGAEFAEAVHTRYGLEPHVLSGDDEAHLTFLGATSDRDRSDTTPILVFDIGGGSTEMVLGAGAKMSFHVSTQAGVVRQTERHLHEDPPSEAELAALSQDVRAILSDAVPDSQRRLVQHAIGVAGTATSLAAIAQDLEPYDPERVHGYELTAQESAAILDRLKRLPLTERRQVAGLHPDRAPTIIAGVLIFEQVMDLFGLDLVEISEHDILHGAALGLAGADEGPGRGRGA